MKNYVLIYFKNKKPIKRIYNTSSKAFFDYQLKGCIYTELFDFKGIKISSFKPTIDG